MMKYLKMHWNCAVKKQKASASMIQRSFRVGYNRAARILDQLHEAGYVGDDEGSKPRKMLLSEAEFEALKAKANAPESDAEQENEQLKTQMKCYHQRMNK